MSEERLSEDFYSKLTPTEQKYAPEAIYFEGNADLIMSKPKVSIIGSRKASQEGLSRARSLARELVKSGITVVSGLADGIDTAAHQATIDSNGNTIAVLGSPLNKPYPKSNTDLLREIKENHLAISQFPIGYPVTAKNFPMRNRTMALISDAVVIVEATEKSGTRHQGWEALRLGRMLFILENVATDEKLSWPKEMIEHGALILNRENLHHLITEIPHFISEDEYAF